ncbi:MAG: LPP20 family lipoprotein [Treponema sp.]|nr:LPP20 family lipoprotein [Treponema sp.]
MKILLSVLGVCVAAFFSACASAPAGSPSAGGNSGASPAEAQAAAQDALNRMDGGQSGGGRAPAAQQGSAASTQQGTTVNTGRNKPAWVDSVDSVYGKAQYVAAVGYAADRALAEKNALASLTAFFGQSIQADQTIVQTYQEAVRNGVTTGWSDNLASQNTIRTSASMDTLIGAEIKEVWFDSRSTHYAVAVMEKTKTAQVYTEMILANQNIINNLVTMSPAEKNSLEGFSRYQFAATVADVTVSYGNLLRVIGAAVPAGIVRGDDYRLEAQNIVKAIPIGVTVSNDKSGRIQGAFAKALTELGFRSGGNNARYVLRVEVTVSPVDLPANANKFARMELSANLTDTGAGAVLLPYNFNNREGHATMPEAENRVYLAAERKINEEYAKLLNGYLSQLLPTRG